VKNNRNIADLLKLDAAGFLRCVIRFSAIEQH